MTNCLELMMEVKPYKPAAIADRESVMEGADMRVSVLTLGPSDCIPWHYHSDITDSFVCLEGPWSSRPGHRETTTS